MTAQTPRTSFRSKVRNFATFLDGVRECAAASEAGRRPSRSALRAAGIHESAFDFIDRG